MSKVPVHDSEGLLSDAYLTSILPGQVEGADALLSPKTVAVQIDKIARVDLACSVLELADEDILWIVNKIYATRPHLKTMVSGKSVNAAAPVLSESETQMNREASKSAHATAPVLEEPKQELRADTSMGSVHPSPAFLESPLTKSAEWGQSKSIEVVAETEDIMRKLMSDSVVEPSAGQSLTSTIVQFSCFMYFCDEDEQNMSLDVMRIGDVTGHSEVHFTTKDGTAIAGQRYEHTSGTLVFEPGETEQVIEIPLIRDDCWNTTLEFTMELLPKGIVGASLGRYLYQTRIKVIDATTFPTNKYKKEIEGGRVPEIPKWGLLIEYLKLNWDNKVVRSGTKKMLLADQVHNLYFMLKLMMSVYMIDYALAAKRPDEDLITKDHNSDLLLLVASTLLPFMLLHYLDYMRLTWKVGGTSRSTLQKSLMRKYLNYTEASRENLSQSDIIMAMTRDTVDLVHVGYMNSLAVVKSVGELLVIFIFQVIAPEIFGKKQRPLIYLPLVIFPFILLPFLVVRRERTNFFEAARNRAQNDLVGRVSRTVLNYRLVADYNMRPLFVSWYEAVIKVYNGADSAAAKVMKNNHYFSPWFTLLFACSYIVIGGGQVLDDNVELSLGMFLTNLKVIYAVGNAYGSIYKTLLTMQSCFDSLESVVHLMNLPIDLPDRMVLNRSRRAMTSKMRVEFREQYAGIGVPLDHLPLRVHNVEFKYCNQLQTSKGVNLLGHMEIQQGSLVSLVGAASEGRSTLLKILGGVILPSGGTCFVPSHLRVLHVSLEPYFMQGTILQNLTFGLNPGDPDGNPARVKNICSMLGMSQEVCSLIDCDQVLPWTSWLTQTQRHLVNLARALIANPEVLCVHKPTLVYDEKLTNRIVNVLQEFVRKKGVDQEPSDFHLRRPRTCIMTSAKFAGVEAADQVCRVSLRGVEMVSKEEVSSEMIA